MINSTHRRKEDTTIRLITDFHNGHHSIRKYLRKHWYLLYNNPSIQQYISHHPQIGFRRAPNLRDKLCPSFLQLESPGPLFPKPKGFYTCTKCSTCKLGLNRSTTTNINGKEFIIQDFINCESTNVVYLIFRPCQKAYIGSTIRPLKIRIQKHYRNVLKLEAKAPLVEHFQEFHSNERTFTFCGLQRITLSPRGGNLHLRLRQEESRMIINYDTVNTGLNKDHEWHYWLL
ncbi:hypothetical protein NDU88_000016 [Pleurodeles waltl]|uniref:GIY-YIG domain-containing protein n=1 Tax=Pleurodeles waltl TaxID=8319 RepID=A0AAV7S3E2_PLEWA|nr:hypothetical protein NDU88_000016 [Pleurodeles waltl]